MNFYSLVIYIVLPGGIKPFYGDLINLIFLNVKIITEYYRKVSTQ